MRKMGYIGGLGKNGQGIFAPINPIVQTSRVGLQYDPTTASSPTSNSKVLEENSPDKYIDDMDANVILDENVVASNFAFEKTKNELYAHPNQKKIPKNQHYWSISSSSFRSLQKRRERMNYGPFPTIMVDCGWIDEWSWPHLNQCLKNSYHCLALIVHC